MARRAALWALTPPAGVLVLAATAQVTRSAATWFGFRGPLCPLGHLLGEHACPGCGLTRATAFAVQGQWGDALAVNPGGLVVAGLCVAAVLLQLDVVRRGRVLPGHLRLRSLGRWCFLIAIFAAWAARASGCLPR